MNSTEALPVGTLVEYTGSHRRGRSRFAVAADRWSNCDVLPDEPAARTEKIRAMHAHATQA